MYTEKKKNSCSLEVKIQIRILNSTQQTLMKPYPQNIKKIQLYKYYTISHESRKRVIIGEKFDLITY